MNLELCSWSPDEFVSVTTENGQTYITMYFGTLFTLDYSFVLERIEATSFADDFEISIILSGNDMDDKEWIWTNKNALLAENYEYAIGKYKVTTKITTSNFIYLFNVSLYNKSNIWAKFL